VNTGFGDGWGYGWAANQGMCLSGGSAGSPYIDPIKFKNISILRDDGVTERDLDLLWYPGGIYHPDEYQNTTCENCVASDVSSFADLASDQDPGMVINCRDSINPDDQVESIFFQSDVFGRPKYIAGGGVFNWGAVPDDVVTDYNGVEYGLGGFYPIGPLQFIIIEGDADYDAVLYQSKMLLSMRRRSFAKINGKPVYPGDWPFDPTMGSNQYEIKTVNGSNIKLAEKYTLLALEPLIRHGAAKHVSAVASADRFNKNRIKVKIVILTTQMERIAYTHFYEVG
jgi:hypothetical protein